MKVSFVIPCYRSTATLPTVVEEIRSTMESIGEDYEVILINDASPDDTFETIRKLCADNRKVIGVEMISSPSCQPYCIFRIFTARWRPTVLEFK